MQHIIDRRRFLATAGTAAAAAAAATGLGSVARATGINAPNATALDAAAPSTLDQRIVLPPGTGYRQLAFGPGEPFVVREDLAVAANPARTATRQSVVFFAHHSDTHILDAQSPARFDTGEVLWALGAGDGFRPQETLTTQVADAMVRAANKQATSPVTGAAQQFAVVTGDVTDSCVASEVRWFVDVLDGKTIEANSGTPGRYEGPQSFPESDFAYHPDKPSLGVGYAQHGFPTYQGLLEAAVSPFQAEGSAVPWYTVFGNHDVLWVGSFANIWVRDLIAQGNIRASRLEGLAPTLLLSGVPEGFLRDLVRQGWEQRGRSGARTVTANPALRHSVKPAEFMSEMFDTAPQPGPVGHGFTAANLATGTTWWSRTDGPVHYIGLDSTNHFRGSEGGIHETQWKWLLSELSAHADKLIVVFSHHNSATMENFDVDPAAPQRIHSGHELVDLLASHRNVVAWINGHIHANRIVGHRSPSGDGGFWEVTAASCIDFPQQSRMIEVVDNHDGTLSLFTYVLDHASDPAPAGGSYTPTKLASISRELSANDPFRYGAFDGKVPTDAAGEPEDRNVELLLSHPFP